MRRRYILYGAAALILAAAVAGVIFTGGLPERTIKEPGKPARQTKIVYDGWLRTSRYVPARDGTRLAADIYRPAKGGKPAEEKLPVIWTQTIYHRAQRGSGKVIGMPDSIPSLQEALKQGYAVAVVDARGTGASFGAWKGLFMPEEARDAWDITEWLAVQPWCNGNIGMFGGSYLGMTQYMAAAGVPPHLKALVPAVSFLDVYNIAAPGGVIREDLIRSWGEGIQYLNTTIPGVPVDEDTDGSMSMRALREHAGNTDIFRLLSELVFSNSASGLPVTEYYRRFSPFSRLDAIKKSKIPVYHMGGWYDAFIKDTFLFYKNLDNPQKILVGPWPHHYLNSAFSSKIIAEHIKWYDYWLKGIQNGVMEEPAVRYYTMGSIPEDKRWKSASRWPLPNEVPTTLFIHPVEPGRGGLEAEGSLTAEKAAAEGTLKYKADYTASTGKGTRWTDVYGGGFGYPDMNGNDRKGLTLDFQALAKPLEVTGHPVADLYVSVSSGDADVFVYLEDVDEKGVSHYVTEGTLKISRWGMADAPYDNLGLPYHRSFEGNLQNAGGAPLNLKLDLLPTSYVFGAGHRIRINITCADRDNARVTAANPPAELTLYTGGSHASLIQLPVIPAIP